jgi:hypothetical protein
MFSYFKNILRYRDFFPADLWAMLFIIVFVFVDASGCSINKIKNRK